MHYMLGNLCDLTTEHQTLRYNCVTALLKVYEEMEPTAWQNDGSSTAKIADLGRQHLLLYAQLSEASADDTKWRRYPKHHLFAHAVSRCLVNPRLEWNYLDEAEMGVTAVLASVSNQCTVETALLARYRATFKAEYGALRIWTCAWLRTGAPNMGVSETLTHQTSLSLSLSSPLHAPQQLLNMSMFI